MERIGDADQTIALVVRQGCDRLSGIRNLYEITDLVVFIACFEAERGFLAQAVTGIVVAVLPEITARIALLQHIAQHIVAQVVRDMTLGIGAAGDVAKRIMGKDRKSTRLNSSHVAISYA